MLVINPKQRAGPPTYFPLGIGYITASIAEESHDVRVLDLDVNPGADLTIARKFDVVCTGGLVTAWKKIEDIVTKVHACSDAKIIVGNSIVTSADLFVKNVPVDFGVVGEGELVIKDVLKTIEDGGDLADVKNPRPPIKDLDSIAPPAWGLFDMGTYTKNPIYGAGFRKSINLISSRGCPYNCGFCFEPLGRQYRWRSAEGVVAEMKYLKQKYGVRFISFSDPCFVINRDRVFELCDLMIKEKLGIRWAADGRANLIDDEICRRMRDAKCRFIDMGFESGSDVILKNINKQATREQALNAVRVCRKHKIAPSGTAMVGYFGETRATAEETVSFYAEADVEPPTSFFYATPFPSTPLYKWAVDNKRIRDELAYQRNLGEMKDLMPANLTDMTDDELRRLKAEMESAAKKNYVRRHPLWPAKNLLLRAYNFYKYYGALGLVRRAVRRGS